MNELFKSVQNRLELVNHRMEALQKEFAFLEAEQIHLKELAKLYKDMDYDPIEEERRVTSALLQVAATKEKSNRGGNRPKGISIFDEAIEIIFKSYPNPISSQRITDELINLMGVSKKQMGSILNYQIKHKRITRIGYGQYIWTGGSRNAGTEAIPAGRPSETAESIVCGTI